MSLFPKGEVRKQNPGTILHKLLKIDWLPFTLSLCTLKEAKHTEDESFLVFFLSSVLTIWSVFRAYLKNALQLELFFSPLNLATPITILCRHLHVLHYCAV